LSVPASGQLNAVDRVVSWFRPQAGVDRLRARTQLALASSRIAYTGARRDRAQTRNWRPPPGSADSHVLPAIADLRDRSRDLTRNAPLAVGAMNAALTETVGVGFTVKAAIDGTLLGLSDDEADAWERRAERIFRTLARTRQLDVTRRLTFAAQTYQLVWSTLEAGDTLVVRRASRRKGELLSTKFQFVEADRVSNRDDAPDTRRSVAGVEFDGEGVPLRYSVRNTHPDDHRWQEALDASWTAVPAYGKSGQRISWLFMRQMRPDQTRGVPWLAPVVEALKEIAEYGANELAASVVNSLFSVIVKTDIGDEETSRIVQAAEAGTPKPTAPDLDLRSGLVLEADPTDVFEFVDPKRPNVSFEQFVLAWVRQIGSALGIPYEVLIRHFSSSFSASQAAMLEAYRFFMVWQQWVVDDWCQPAYELVVYEAVTTGLLEAPGFLDDALIRQAWLGTKWIGPRRGVIRPDMEVQAAAQGVREGFTTIEDEAARLYGGDFEKIHEQRAREIRLRREAGLDIEPVGERVLVESAEDPFEEGTK